MHLRHVHSRGYQPTASGLRTRHLAAELSASAAIIAKTIQNSGFETVTKRYCAVLEIAKSSQTLTILNLFEFLRWIFGNSDTMCSTATHKYNSSHSFLNNRCASGLFPLSKSVFKFTRTFMHASILARFYYVGNEGSIRHLHVKWN